MNIFVLDTDPVLAAQYHCDKHVVKMILESAQILSTVTGVGYRPTHKSHPCTLWAGEYLGNALWVAKLAEALNKEYIRRYHKHEHKSWGVIRDMIYPELLRMGLYGEIPIGNSPSPQCMPDEYKHEDPVQAYRNYYKGDKVRFATWKNRETPYWWN